MIPINDIKYKYFEQARSELRYSKAIALLNLIEVLYTNACGLTTNEIATVTNRSRSTAKRIIKVLKEIFGEKLRIREEWGMHL